MMYKYLAILVVLILFVIGCTDESNMVGPVNNTVNNEMINKQAQNSVHDTNQPVENVDNSNKSIINPGLIIFPDTTKDPGYIHPDSRWGFIN